MTWILEHIIYPIFSSMGGVRGTDIGKYIQYDIRPPIYHRKRI